MTIYKITSCLILFPGELFVMSCQYGSFDPVYKFLLPREEYLFRIFAQNKEPWKAAHAAFREHSPNHLLCNGFNICYKGVGKQTCVRDLPRMRVLA